VTVVVQKTYITRRKLIELLFPIKIEIAHDAAILSTNWKTSSSVGHTCLVFGRSGGVSKPHFHFRWQGNTSSKSKIEHKTHNFYCKAENRTQKINTAHRRLASTKEKKFKKPYIQFPSAIHQREMWTLFLVSIESNTGKVYTSNFCELPNDALQVFNSVRIAKDHNKKGKKDILLRCRKQV
jgi:hypothetical protein